MQGIKDEGVEWFGQDYYGGLAKVISTSVAT